jgi:hypothetical protein
MDMGVQTAVEGGAPATGASMAAPMGCAAAADLTCKAQSTTGWKPTWIPPAGLHKNKCDSSQLYAFVSACGAKTATHDTCQAFLKASENTICASCIVTPDDAASYGPFITDWYGGNLNVPGCLAALDSTQLQTAKDIQAADQCFAKSCAAGCSDASEDKQNQCMSDSYDVGCATYFDKANADGLPGSGPAAMCNTLLSSSTESTFFYYANLFCGT